MRDKIIEILEQNGIFIENTENDFDITEYIEDSLQFITFIVSLEEEFNINFPNEMISLDNLKSFNAFCDIIVSIIKSK